MQNHVTGHLHSFGSCKKRISACFPPKNKKKSVCIVYISYYLGTRYVHYSRLQKKQSHHIPWSKVKLGEKYSKVTVRCFNATAFSNNFIFNLFIALESHKHKLVICCFYFCTSLYLSRWEQVAKLMCTFCLYHDFVCKPCSWPPKDFFSFHTNDTMVWNHLWSTTYLSDEKFWNASYKCFDLIVLALSVALGN